MSGIWSEHPTLEGARVRLEPLTGTHAPGLFAAVDDPDTIFRWSGAVIRDPSDAQSFVRAAVADRMNAYPQFPPPGTGGYPPPGGYRYPAGYPMHPYGPPPNNNLVYGLVVTIVYCMPIGIVSIVKATRVNALWAQGRFEEAHRAAASARTWAIWSAVAAVLVLAAYVVLYFWFWGLGRGVRELGRRRCIPPSRA
ncbi:CD225/dispanin family protein [Rhodococcus chondri]|uniref:CD225/dispanin family protein n=1 Tax=Rhodococcus chondri TaxID=3065941 RepID=A0ABU7JRH2_9NOCA|nr:CD225/dispanin family protein [Rhodococcus sp. CC-R104]MEE2032631.1 CD225/dispanin family protein [Rhodococcus sp. CC-R104]